MSIIFSTFLFVAAGQDADRQPDLSGLHVQGAYLLSLDQVQSRKDTYRAKWLTPAQTVDSYGAKVALGWEVIGEGSLTHTVGGVYLFNMTYAGTPQRTERMHLFDGRLVSTQQWGCQPVELNLSRRKGPR